jgi:hypothetical protein
LSINKRRKYQSASLITKRPAQMKERAIRHNDQERPSSILTRQPLAASAAEDLTTTISLL